MVSCSFTERRDYDFIIVEEACCVGLGLLVGTGGTWKRPLAIRVDRDLVDRIGSCLENFPDIPSLILVVFVSMLRTSVLINSQLVKRC